jgi:hypothetical protein
MGSCDQVSLFYVIYFPILIFIVPFVLQVYAFTTQFMLLLLGGKQGQSEARASYKSVLHTKAKELP